MTINPNNYLGAATTIVGFVAGPARPPAYDKEGTRGILEISIPVNEGYSKDGDFIQTGTTWYTYTAASEAANALKALQKGDKIRIDGAKQEVREYTDKDGKERLGIGLRFGELTVLESKAPAETETPW